MHYSAKIGADREQDKGNKKESGGGERELMRMNDRSRNGWNDRKK